MSQYRAYFVPGAMDPWGLWFQFERHHWIPQNKKSQADFKKVCPNISVHFFVTPLKKGYDGDANGVADHHGYIHNSKTGFDWNNKVSQIVNKKKTNCCEVLKSLDALIRQAWKELNKRDPKLHPNQFPELEIFVKGSYPAKPTGADLKKPVKAVTTWSVPNEPNFNPPNTNSIWNVGKQKWDHLRPPIVKTNDNWTKQVDECKNKPTLKTPTTNCRTDVEATAKPIWP